MKTRCSIGRGDNFMAHVFIFNRSLISLTYVVVFNRNHIFFQTLQLFKRFSREQGFAFFRREYYWLCASVPIRVFVIVHLFVNIRTIIDLIRTLFHHYCHYYHRLIKEEKESKYYVKRLGMITRLAWVSKNALATLRSRSRRSTTNTQGSTIIHTRAQYIHTHISSFLFSWKLENNRRRRTRARRESESLNRADWELLLAYP